MLMIFGNQGIEGGAILTVGVDAVGVGSLFLLLRRKWRGYRHDEAEGVSSTAQALIEWLLQIATLEGTN